MNKEKRFNHNPLVTGVWIDYNGSRFNDIYDVKLKSGELLIECRAGNYGWIDFDKKPIQEKEIEQIRLKHYSEIKKPWCTTDMAVMARLGSHGVWYPTYFRARDEFLYPDEYPVGEYVKPKTTLAYRRAFSRMGKDYGNTWFVVGEASFVNEPHHFILPNDINTYLWDDDHHTLLMPEELKKRLVVAEQRTRVSFKHSLVMKEILKEYRSFPAELLGDVGIVVGSREDVQLLDNNIKVPGGSFRDVLDEIIEETKRKLLEKYRWHPEQAILMTQYNLLKGIKK